MSEYQYYEFVAVDRPLTEKEQQELRKVSSRAKIDSRSFVNTYNYSDLRGDPEKLVARYFDAHFYAANWGSYSLMFRLPRRLVDEKRLQAYRTEETLAISVSGEFCIAGIRVDEFDTESYMDAEEYLPKLLPLRSDILRGDLRSLYLGWLLAYAPFYDPREEEVDEEVADVLEPPVPPGLGELSPALKVFVELFEMDEDLIAAAAERSAPSKQERFSDEKFAEWLAGLPEAEKNDLLRRAVVGEEVHLRLELQPRFEREVGRVEPEADGGEAPPRSVAELMRLARQKREKRKQKEAEEREKKRRKEALAREKHLDTLVGQEKRLWQKVQELIETKQQDNYDQAVVILCDLRDLAKRAGHPEAFAEPVRELRERYKSRSALLRRFAKAKF